MSKWRLPRMRPNTQIVGPDGAVSPLFHQWWGKIAQRVEMQSRVITASGTVLVTDYLILANATGGAITVTLPEAAENQGRVLVVKKTDASVNAVTLDGNGSETIDGAATKALSAQYAGTMILSDGSGWWVI